LDDHQFLLRQSLHGLADDRAHIKTLASELRTLICMSSGTEGLLWRLADDLNVSDVMELQVAESVNRDHPLNRSLTIWKIPFHRPAEGIPGPPVEKISLRDVIKNCEAIYVSQISDRVFTHERLIGAIAGQMGGAHEAEGLDDTLVRLNRILINHRQLYFEVLAFDAELALEVGERVLDHAEKHRGYRRASRPADYGDSTFLVRFALRDTVFGRVPIVTFHSPIAEANITCSADPRSAVFTLEKRGATVAELEAPYPPDWPVDHDAMFTLSYSSRYRKARTITNDQQNGEPADCDFGWFDARELAQPLPHPGAEHSVAVKCVPIYKRLLSPTECGQLLQVSADARELRTQSPPGPFPT
jgi:hypothetical protein